MTDGDLLHRYAAAGDGGAFKELVRRHGGMVHAAARRLAGDGDADDVVQAVFLLLAQRAAKLARHRNVAGWLYNVTRYCASNARRTRGRRERHLERYQRQEAAMERDAAPAPSTDNDAAVAALLDAGLAKLKDDQRQAVLLRYIEGLSLDEAAARLGINAPAVAKRAERGIARDHFGQPTAWSTYDATGERYTMRVITTTRGDERQGTREVSSISFFDAAENEREWHMQPANVAWLELLNNPIGDPIRTLNQAPRPRRAPATTRSATTRAAATR